ncbi:MAG: hypothetical protein NUV47_01990 [Patescibacteria group bacterium]|nr:hypothetical protein [Patescibacteria group bacterium]
MLSPFKSIGKIIVYIFAFIGFVLVVGYFAVKFGLTNTKGIIDNQQSNFIQTEKTWNIGEEWETLKTAIIKDEEVIKRAGEITGIPSRLIVAQLVVEQLRLYHSNRELFKKIFYPLKLLGNQNQFSWGVMGIKEETAKLIEKHLKDTSSIYYLGLSYENILDFETKDKDKERFTRITKEDDRYYSYLYTALYIKQILTQWEKAGFPITDRIDIISTLYNIGFKHSIPNANPQSGGAIIEIKNVPYSFGTLAKNFYNSNELIEYFPKN